MTYKFGKTIVIALGGSIVHPDAINVKFLKNFRKFVLKWVRRGKKFMIVTGGGSVARDYQKAANAVISLSDEDKDWIGIHATRLNAHLLRTIFWKEADPVIIDSHSKSKSKRMVFPVTIASGWRPGWSTDYVALQIASCFGARETIIAGSPAYVYTKDPKKDKSAWPIKQLHWKEYRKLIPAKWKPGAHSPVDPVGARLAGSRKLAAIIIKGTDLKNFDNLLAGKDFKGTLIK